MLPMNSHKCSCVDYPLLFEQHLRPFMFAEVRHLALRQITIAQIALVYHIPDVDRKRCSHRFAFQSIN